MSQSTDEYPTWVRIDAERWESEEQIDGTPDFIAWHDKLGGWHLKWRSTQQPIGAFRTMDDVRSYTRVMVESMESRVMPSPYEEKRAEIVEGLKRWALGTYNTQAAVIFLAGTNEPLDRVWVRKTKHSFTDETMYYFDWDKFEEHSGVISGGEYATWALARSLHEGELNDQLWRLDPARSAAFGDAIARCREDWPH